MKCLIVTESPLFPDFFQEEGWEIATIAPDWVDKADPEMGETLKENSHHIFFEDLAQAESWAPDFVWVPSGPNDSTAQHFGLSTPVFGVGATHDAINHLTSFKKNLGCTGIPLALSTEKTLLEMLKLDPDEGAWHLCGTYPIEPGDLESIGDMAIHNSNLDCPQPNTHPFIAPKKDLSVTSFVMLLSGGVLVKVFTCKAPAVNLSAWRASPLTETRVKPKLKLEYLKALGFSGLLLAQGSEDGSEVYDVRCPAGKALWGVLKQALPGSFLRTLFSCAKGVTLMLPSVEQPLQQSIVFSDRWGWVLTPLLDQTPPVTLQELQTLYNSPIAF